MNDVFCPIPWIFQAVRSNGDIRVCCQANITKNKGVLRKSDGTAYNAGQDDLNESRNSDLMKIMRLNMLNGVWSDECARCKQEEESGLNSRRKYETAQWKFSIEDAKNQTAEDGSIDVNKTPIQYYDLRFGNLCNLACRMCGPTDSSFWYDDWVNLTNTTEFKDTNGMVKLEHNGSKFSTTAFDWHTFDNFWLFLEKNMHNLEHVYMAGGEPLLIERHYEFLQKCIDNNVAKNICLEYNTNCSTLPPRVLNLWKQFKQVRVGASIDGFGDILEYQRYPAKWSKIVKNLTILNNQPDNIIVWLAYTVTVYNVLHVPDFIKWKLQSGLDNINKFKRKPLITHHVAHNPKHLNIRALPAEMKYLITTKYIEFRQWIAENYPDYNQAADVLCNGIINYMMAEDYNAEYWSEFITYTKRLDTIRGQNILDIVPELQGFLNG